VLRAIGNGAICTINALQPQQHTGGGGNSYGRPGRIAGSVNLPACAFCSIRRPTRSCLRTNFANASKRSAPWTGR